MNPPPSSTPKGPVSHLHFSEKFSPCFVQLVDSGVRRMVVILLSEVVSKVAHLHPPSSSLLPRRSQRPPLAAVTIAWTPPAGVSGRHHPVDGCFQYSKISVVASSKPDDHPRTDYHRRRRRVRPHTSPLLSLFSRVSARSTPHGVDSISGHPSLPPSNP